MISVRALKHEAQGRIVLSLPAWDMVPEAAWLVQSQDRLSTTAFLHSLTGLVRPTCGQILVRDEDVTALSATDLASLRSDFFGIAFQDPRLLPALTVMQNLELARSLSRKPSGDQAFDAALRAVGVDQHKYSKPHDLTPDEAQKVAIARAIVTDPKVLICVEPTATQTDAVAVSRIELLKNICRYRKLALIIISQDIRLKSKFNDCLMLDVPS